MGLTGKRDKKRWLTVMAAAALVCSVVISALPAIAAEKKPNILVIWGDDIGQFNISAYNMGMMGYK
ncbi:MAG: arylsulfatase, partial [Deltaproteobacteria bacterium]|nr:arylsulfatase [Deltaproteobacteria bacterium]MBP2682123.1 arylsulfatase [Deltaproteobacteria bacterium]